MESDVLLDRRLAFAFLRITLGLNILMHGAVRLPILSVFVAGLVKEFAKTPLPAVAVKAFAYSLPFEEGLVSLFVLVGLWTRNTPLLGASIIYKGSGVQPTRTWVISPDADSLVRRWRRLVEAPLDKKEHLFHATLRDGEPSDRHIRSVVKEGLPGHKPILKPLIARQYLSSRISDCRQPL